jgi:hypothetical protein
MAAGIPAYTVSSRAECPDTAVALLRPNSTRGISAKDFSCAESANTVLVDCPHQAALERRKLDASE